MRNISCCSMGDIPGPFVLRPPLISISRGLTGLDADRNRGRNGADTFLADFHGEQHFCKLLCGLGEAMQTSDYELRLILDGLYYIGAKETCSQLVDADARYVETERRLKEIDEEIIKIESRYERREDAYDEAESLFIQSAGWWEEYQNGGGDAYSRRGHRSYAVRQLSRSPHKYHRSEKLIGATFAEFDKLSLYGKWLFYPQVSQIGV